VFPRHGLPNLPESTSTDLPVFVEWNQLGFPSTLPFYLNFICLKMNRRKLLALKGLGWAILDPNTLRENGEKALPADRAANSW
jgi:hypothetical protein